MKKIILVCCIAAVMTLSLPLQTDAAYKCTSELFGVCLTAEWVSSNQCGGSGQPACWEWNSCAIYVWPSCYGGWVLSPPYNGCDNDRLNNYFGTCGSSVEVFHWSRTNSSSAQRPVAPLTRNHPGIETV